MNIAMRAHDFETNTLEELTAKCNKYSITHIQLALKKSIKDFQEGEFSPGYAKSIGDELNKSGVKVSVLGCYINPSETNPQRLQKNIDYFVENLYYAKYIGADMVGLETGFVGEKLDVNKNNTEEAYRHLLKTMKILCTEAEHIGVKIGIEGVHCFVINTPQKMKRLIDDLESDNVCVIFDPVNYLNYDNYTNQDNIINDYFNLLSNRTEVIHLKDFKLNNGILSYEYPCNG
ncbi:MAG: sugar phosphate isomerase/epimerase, partial [Clostridia bacterium]|nr:sugar phosphate isomerase/epimerase [Clostridia bacterium]